jgi:cytochrome c biogenesis protein CcmG/thiol:disulfide interchange protein DsbE
MEPQVDETTDETPATGGAEGADGELDVPRRGRTALVVSLVMALLLAAFVFVLATREPATNRRADSPLVGRVAPALAGGTLDGGRFDIDDHPGRWVVVNFFATWCVPCRTEHPELDSFDRTHRDRGDAVLVSVLYDDQTDDAAEFFADNGGDWPVVLDSGGVAVAYGVSAVPETFMVDPDGRVAAKLTGGVTRDGLEGIMQDWEQARIAGSGS